MVQIPVRIFAVNAYNSCRVPGTLHPAFNLQGIYAGFQDVRQDIQGTEVLQAQDVFLILPVHDSWLPLAMLSFVYPVRQTAGLGTAPAVSAAAADQAAHQTLAGITVTERSMDKTLNLHVHLIPDPPDLI